MIVILGTGGLSVSGVTLLEEPLVAAWPCVVLPWGRAGAGRQGGPVLEHTEQRGNPPPRRVSPSWVSPAIWSPGKGAG